MTALQSLGAPRPRGLAVGLTCFSGKGVGGEHRDCRSLPSAGPQGGHGYLAGPRLMAQVRRTTAPCGRRHGHGAGHHSLPPPLADCRFRKTAFAGLSRRRPGSSRGAWPCPPLVCIMGNVVRSARPPRGGEGRGSGQSPGLGLTQAGVPASRSAFCRVPAKLRHLPKPIAPGGPQAQTRQTLCPSEQEVYLEEKRLFFPP